MRPTLTGCLQLKLVEERLESGTGEKEEKQTISEA